MAEGFEIKVPISIKGGREGERVGKQIGQKVAEQLKKTLQSVKIGSGGAGSVGSSSGLPGVLKGLKGVTAKLGAIGVAIGAAVGLLTKSSPYLKGILDIFGRAFMIFFRPFGDFLATLLRPLAILMMKMAVAFLKWTRPISGRIREAVKEAPQFPTTGNMLADIPIMLGNWALKVGAAIGQLVLEIGKAAWDLGEKIGDWLFFKVIEPAGEYLADKLLGIWKWTENFAGWVWQKVTSIWDWNFDISTWFWNKLTSIWIWTRDFGSWLWDTITNAFKNLGSWLSGIGMFLYEQITRSIKSAFSGFAFGWSWFWKKGQVGIPNVPNDGLYQLHKGEEVIPKTKVGGSKSVILNPTFNFTGNISRELDIDAIARRAGRMTEMELKQRGIL